MRPNVLIVKFKRCFLIEKKFNLDSATVEEIFANIITIKPLEELQLKAKKIVDHLHALPDKKDFTEHYENIGKDKKFPEEYYEAERNIHQWYELSFKVDDKNFNIVDLLKQGGITFPLVAQDEDALSRYLTYDSINELYNTDDPDPWYRSHQYHFRKSEMEYIWEKQSGDLPKSSKSPLPLLAIIDSGLNTTIAPKEIEGKNYELSYDKKKYDAYDAQNRKPYHYNYWDNTSKHGTMIAGILAAHRNGEAGQGNFFSSKVLDIRAFGNGADSTLMNAIAFATYKGAKVINCSWGPKRHQKKNRLIEEVLRFAFWRKSLCVFAAGNQGNDVEGYYPANNKDVITVGALSKNDKVLPRTNYGVGIDTFAYGEDILSLAGIKLKSGTSVAAPQVAGLLALILSLFPRIKDEAPSPGFFIIRIKNLLRCIPPGRIKPEKGTNIRPSLNPIDPLARRINAKELYDYAQKYYPNPPKGKPTT